MSKSDAVGRSQGEPDARTRFEAATFGSPDWMVAAEEYASTPQGHDHLVRTADAAHMSGDQDMVATLRVAIKRGDTRRALNAETSRLRIREKRPNNLHREFDAVSAQFSVGREQVRRDHIISHLLGALSAMERAEDLIFFGGTALSRTYLPSLRLSEDIDLITTSDRRRTAGAVQQAIERGLQRSYGKIDWSVSLVETKGSEPAVLTSADGTRVQIQLISSEGYANWPTTTSQLIQRYTDAPAATLTTFTPAAFAAAKTVAWANRAAPRDLYDLWALGEHGYITADAAALYRRHGPTGNPPTATIFFQAPSDAAWADALQHQTRIRIGPREALERVKMFWDAAITTSA